MNPRPIEPAVPVPLPTGLPCWEKLPPEERRAIMIALTAMLVKRLPGRDKCQEAEDD